MRMEVREQSKVVELWLTRQEKDDAAFREALKPLCQQYKVQNCLPTYFNFSCNLLIDIQMLSVIK